MENDKKLKEFIYQKNGWSLPQIKKTEADKNLKGDRCGKLLYDGQVIIQGAFPLLQKKKKEMLGYGCKKDRFKITY